MILKNKVIRNIMRFATDNAIKETVQKTFKTLRKGILNCKNKIHKFD